MGKQRRRVGGCLVPFLIVFAIVVVRGAPYSDGSDVCADCGRTRGYYEWCGLRLWQWIAENDTSRWMDTLLKDHTEHDWQGDSGEGRSEWFSSTVIAWDGDGGVPHIVHSLKPGIGEERAKEYIARYLRIREGDGDGSGEGMKALRGEIYGVMNSAHARPPQTQGTARRPATEEPGSL
ncbi:MAG: hypothetical protein GY851_21470 [bacterium]|nr:hypothetical protein [bacterium]